MYLFPLVLRELRTAPRRKSTWRIRFIVGALSSVIILMVANTGAVNGFGKVAGAGAFRFMAGLLFLFCLIEGFRNSADCLSEEKREGTLGLLLLTDLSPVDVILGKLASFALNSLSVIAAAIPGITFAIILGGVTFGEVMRMALACLVALSVSMTVGVCTSAVEFDERKAMAKAAVRLLALLAVPFIFQFATQWVSSFPVQFIHVFNPLGVFINAFDVSFTTNIGVFWNSVLGCTALSLGLIVLASRTLTKRWNIEPDHESDSPHKLADRPRLNKGRLGTNDCHLPGFDDSEIEWIWRRQVAGLVGRRRLFWWVLIYLIPRMGIPLLFPVSFVVFVPIGIMVLMALIGLLGVVAVKPLATLRSSGMFEALLATPFNIQTFVLTQKEWISKFAFRMTWAVVGIEFFAQIVIVGVRSWMGASGGGGQFFPAAIISAILLLSLLALNRAVINLGIWTAITERKEGRALVKTLMWSLGPIILCVIMPCFGILIVWFVMIHLGSWSDKKLKTDLRETIVERMNVSAHESTFLPYGYMKTKALRPPRKVRRVVG